MAGPTRAEIVEKAADGTLLEAIFTEYGRRWVDKDDTLLTELVAAHNSGDVDLIALITPEALAPYSGSTFFAGQHVYNSIISRLETSAEALVRAVHTLIEAGGHDGASGIPADELSKWCASEPTRPAELLDLVDRKIPHAENYLAIAIKNGALIDPIYFTDRSYDFLANGSQVEKVAALNALGQITLRDGPDEDRLESAFQAIVDSDAEDVVRAALLRSIVRRLGQTTNGRADALSQIAVAAVAKRDDQVLYAAAQVLAFDAVAIGPELSEALLLALKAVNPSHVGTINMIDIALAKAVGTGDDVRARRFLEDLLAREEGFSFQQFDSLQYKLFEVGGETLENWMVAWLRQGDLVQCREFSSGLLGAGREEHMFSIDFSRFDLSDAEYGYIARKAVGWLFLKPKALVSFLVCLRRSAPVSQAEDIEALIMDPVLTSYPTVVEEYLKPLSEDPADPVAPVAEAVLTELSKRLQRFKSIGRVPELRPSERERQLEWQRHSDEMTSAFRDARNKSPLLSMIHESVMLYGKRSVTWVSDPRKKPTRITTELSSFSHSFDFPQSDVVDPVGLQMELLHFRLEKHPS